jgi:hypothetical protein
MLEEAMENSISNSTAMKDAKDKLQGDMRRLKTATSEAKYELVVSHYSATWYKSTTDSLERIASILVSTTLAVEQEKKVIHMSKIASQFDAARSDEKQVSAEVPVMVETTGSEDPQNEQHLERCATESREYLLPAKTPYSSVQRINYKLLPIVQQSVSPHVNTFLSVCCRCFCALQYRMSKNKVFSSHLEFMEDMEEDKYLASCSSNELHDLMLTAVDELKKLEFTLQRSVERYKGHPKEEHYLVYTLVFTLMECGHEILKLDQYTKDLISKRTKNRRLWIPNVSFMTLLSKTSRLAKGSSPATQAFLDNKDNNLLPDMRRTASRMHQDPEIIKYDEQEDDFDDIESSYQGSDYEEPLQNAVARRRWKRALMSFNRWLQYDPTRYAFKFALSMEIIALAAWLPVPGLNTLYNLNHGQWALISGMVISSLTMGASLLQSGIRIIATIIAALWAYLGLLAAQQTGPYILSLMILVFAGPFWYVFLGTKFSRLGMICLLTLVVVVNTGHQNSYNNALFDVVWKRTLAAIFSVFVVMTVNYLFWPVWARDEMRKQLAMLIMDTGIYYFQVASLACHNNTTSKRWQITYEETEKESKVLQQRLDTITELFALSATEPRFTKAAFPREVYASIIDHERNILFWISHMKRSQVSIPSDVH